MSAVQQVTGRVPIRTAAYEDGCLLRNRALRFMNLGEIWMILDGKLTGPRPSCSFTVGLEEHACGLKTHEGFAVKKEAVYYVAELSDDAVKYVEDIARTGVLKDEDRPAHALFAAIALSRDVETMPPLPINVLLDILLQMDPNLSTCSLVVALQKEVDRLTEELKNASRSKLQEESNASV